MIARKEDGTLLTPEEFSVMSDADITELVTESDKTDLAMFLSTLSRMRAFSWKDRMLLQMIEKSPFTYWASDKAYKVRLWEGKSGTVYARDMLEREFHEFISRYERRNAMSDSIKIIDAQDTALLQLIADFENYYTRDIVGNKAAIGLVTNSIQLIDEISGETFYAEIGVPIDLQKALDEFNERQKEFENEIKGFEKRCDELIDEATDIQKEMKTKINNSDGLARSRKHDLRELCTSEFSAIIRDFKTAKKETATNLEKFISDAEESIQLVKDKIAEAIDNETITILRTTVGDSEHKRVELEQRLKELKMNSGTLFAHLIVEVKAQKHTQVVAEAHKARVAKIEEVNHGFSRQMSDYLQELPQTTAVLLSAVEVAINVMEKEITDYIASEKSGGEQ